ncbi:hypothetical protein [uncultured Ruminobacter sp.]|uniref:hypothetical protein n=1 Tax=uncultured Ruminobacter sp. TaxID=538947 RepID=UPI0025D305CF|nr:hypothetical protein [uncultured Ruminobacter sp.]
MSLSDEINEVLESEQKEQFKKKLAKKLFFRDENGEVYELYKLNSYNWDVRIHDLLNRGEEALKKWSEYMFKSDTAINDFDCESAFKELLESSDRKAEVAFEKLIDRESLKLTDLGAKFIRNIPCELDTVDLEDLENYAVQHMFSGSKPNDKKLEELGVKKVLEDCKTKIYGTLKCLTESVPWFDPATFLGMEGKVMGDPITIVAMAFSGSAGKNAKELRVLFEKAFGDTKYSTRAESGKSQFGVRFCHAYKLVKFQYFFIFCAEKFRTL